VDGRIQTPDITVAERLQGFKANWTRGESVWVDGVERPFNHRRRWMLVGNAVNVEVSKWIGKRLARPKPYDGPIGVPLPAGAPFPQAAYFDGSARYAVDIGTWPVSAPRQSLESFMGERGVPLSHRATAGFYKRARESSLSMKPWFMEGVARHLGTVC